MSIIDNIKNATQTATESGEAYAEATQNYVELKVFHHVALTFSLLVKILLIGGLLFVALVLMLIAGIVVVEEATGSLLITLLSFSAGFLLTACLVYVFRKKLLENGIVAKLSQTFFKK